MVFARRQSGLHRCDASSPVPLAGRWLSCVESARLTSSVGRCDNGQLGQLGYLDRPEMKNRGPVGPCVGVNTINLAREPHQPMTNFSADQADVIRTGNGPPRGPLIDRHALAELVETDRGAGSVPVTVWQITEPNCVTRARREIDANASPLELPDGLGLFPGQNRTWTASTAASTARRPTQPTCITRPAGSLIALPCPTPSRRADVDLTGLRDRFAARRTLQICPRRDLRHRCCVPSSHVAVRAIELREHLLQFVVGGSRD
jgi:hypothetical protein